MAESSRVIESMSRAAGGGVLDSSNEVHRNLAGFQPKWDEYQATKGLAGELKAIEVDDVTNTRHSLLNPNLVKVLFEAVPSVDDVLPAQWIVKFLYDMVRENAGAYTLFEDALKASIPIYAPMMSVLQKQNVDPYVFDKSAWLLTAVIGNSPRFFNEQQVRDVVAVLKKCADARGPLSCLEGKQGILEAITNLLKADVFRGLVWNEQGVQDWIFGVPLQSAPSPYVYKCVFAIWMLSFDDAIAASLKEQGVTKKIKEIVSSSRVEKVVRLCLTVLKNLLGNTELCEDIVEEGILEIVQQLEFDKWRDADLYDVIRDMSALISAEVSALSNFDRYERELQTGKLKWGFIHSGKFWAENVMKFEAKDFEAFQSLERLLMASSDPTTLAVACHDIGEFVALHPLGKKKVAEFHVKERVMSLMGSTDPSHREVRREALLCCQKIMLNKWQDIGAGK